MILSSRPTDRRQLIEEAAGITKYKARRRAAELKLDAAQQNLTRIDDIVFEVEKQRARSSGRRPRRGATGGCATRCGAGRRCCSRGATCAGRTIEAARTRLADTREHEASAAARLAEVENELSALRIEQAEADAAAGRARDEAHARELEINRRQQQIALDKQQAEMLARAPGARRPPPAAEDAENRP
jgi:chromosome segregation protein